MIDGIDNGRRELTALGDALTSAERKRVGSATPTALAARLMRVARCFPGSVDHALMWQITDLVAGRDIGDAYKLTIIRMGWASILQAEFKAHGLRIVGAETVRPQARAA